jgi:UPF0271 protein
MHTIDINCDMGEGIGNDELIMPFISSANIACGYHAGDEKTMKQTIELAIKNNVAIGAHPSFLDRENFGRTEKYLSNKEIYDLIITQVQALEKISNEFGFSLHHVKPHGALYNMAAKNSELASTICLAIKDINDTLIVYGLSGSHLMIEAKKIGLKTASEVFADRTYQDDGSLTPRSQPNALIEDVEKAVHQALQMVKKKKVTSINGNDILITADTICVHGDGKNAIAFAKAIHDAFVIENIEISTC